MPNKARLILARFDCDEAFKVKKTDIVFLKKTNEKIETQIMKYLKQAFAELLAEAKGKQRELKVRKNVSIGLFFYIYIYIYNLFVFYFRNHMLSSLARFLSKLCCVYFLFKKLFCQKITVNATSCTGGKKNNLAKNNNNNLIFSKATSIGSVLQRAQYRSRF